MRVFNCLKWIWCGPEEYTFGVSTKGRLVGASSAHELFDHMFAMTEEVDYRLNLGESDTLDSQRARIISTVETLAMYHGQTISSISTQLRMKTDSIWLYAADPPVGCSARSATSGFHYKYALYVYFGSKTNFETFLATPAGGCQTMQQNEDRLWICGFASASGTSAGGAI